jgi:hypothetical protein
MHAAPNQRTARQNRPRRMVERMACTEAGWPAASRACGPGNGKKQAGREGARRAHSKRGGIRRKTPARRGSHPGFNRPTLVPLCILQAPRHPGRALGPAATRKSEENAPPPSRLAGPPPPPTPARPTSTPPPPRRAVPPTGQGAGACVWSGIAKPVMAPNNRRRMQCAFFRASPPLRTRCEGPDFSLLESLHFQLTVSSSSRGAAALTPPARATPRLRTALRATPHHHAGLSAGQLALHWRLPASLPGPCIPARGCVSSFYFVGTQAAELAKNKGGVEVASRPRPAASRPRIIQTWSRRPEARALV